jgi:hypothetical protein
MTPGSYDLCIYRGDTGRWRFVSRPARWGITRGWLMSAHDVAADM